MGSVPRSTSAGQCGRAAPRRSGRGLGFRNEPPEAPFLELSISNESVTAVLFSPFETQRLLRRRARDYRDARIVLEHGMLDLVEPLEAMLGARGHHDVRGIHAGLPQGPFVDLAVVDQKGRPPVDHLGYGGGPALEDRK